jgi:uncharacterized protein YhbP (UPF0306 family)
MSGLWLSVVFSGQGEAAIVHGLFDDKDIALKQLTDQYTHYPLLNLETSPDGNTITVKNKNIDLGQVFLMTVNEETFIEI